MLPGTPEAWRAGPRPSGTAAEPGGREHGFAVLPRRPRPGSPTTACGWQGRWGRSVTLGSRAPPKPPGARAWIPGHDDGIESRRPSGSRDHGPGRAVRSPSARGGVSVSAGHPRGSSTPTQSPRPRPGQAGTSACPACPAWGSAVTMAGAVWRPAPCPRGTRPRRQAATAGVSVRVSLSPPDVDRGPQVWRHVWCPTRERVLPASRGRRPGTAEPLQRPDGPRQTAPRWGGCAHRVPRGPEGETGGAEGGAAVAGGPAT